MPLLVTNVKTERPVALGSAFGLKPMGNVYLQVKISLAVSHTELILQDFQTCIVKLRLLDQCIFNIGHCTAMLVPSPVAY